jgi:hypothetical protein
VSSKNDRDTGKLWDNVRKTISLLVLKILQEVSTKIFEKWATTHRFSSRNNERDGLVAETVDVCFGRRELRKCWCRASDKPTTTSRASSCLYLDLELERLN